MRRAARLLAVLAGVAASLLLFGPGAATAHPLGNFTVNQYNGLMLHPDRVELHAVVDSAEIPTLQQQPSVDSDSDGAVSAAEGETWAAGECDELAGAVSATVDGAALRWAVRSAQVTYPPGEGGLATTRLVCELSAPAELNVPASVTFANAFGANRIGWREITAAGRGVGLVESPVPARSVTDELRRYPADPLADPLDVRKVALRTGPAGQGTAGNLAAPVVDTGIGPLDRLVAGVDRTFTGLVGPDPTALAGGLAVLLSLALGAGHALLPGHGKTLIAAYLAGRRGTKRDALLVGTSVTVTHTAAVLVVGLALCAFASLLGETVVGWLAVLSGLLVSAIGVTLLRSARLARRAAAVGAVEPALVGATHGHGHGHGHGSGGASVGRLDRPTLLGMGVAAGMVPSPSALVVLLAAIGLSQTWFGVLLVLGYGVGMAGTLTAVGLLLVHGRDRLQRRIDHLMVGPWAARVVSCIPELTAGLVLVVGLGLAARGIVGIY